MKKSLPVKWAVAMVPAFLLLCPHLRMYSDEWTRYFAFWGRGDAIAIVIVTLLLGTLFLLAHQATRLVKVDLIHRAADATFVMVVGLAVIATLKTGGLGGSTIWNYLAVGVVALGAASLLTRFRMIPRICRAMCLILTPVIPLVMWQFLSYAQYSVFQERLPIPDGPTRPVRLVAAGPSSRPDVYLIVLDGWSFGRTFEDVDHTTEFPNLARIVGQSTFYHDAHSTHRDTRRSLPGMLFETTEKYECRNGQLGFSDQDGVFTEVASRPNLLKEYKGHGYQTHIAGFCHPYRRLFGDELDFAFSAKFPQGNPNDHDMLQSLRRHFRLGLAKSTLAMPQPPAIHWRLQRLWDLEEDAPNTIERLENIHDLALKIIRRPTGPKFALLHYPVPHPPYYFRRSGPDVTVRDEFPLVFGRVDERGFARPDPDHHVARYRGNLRYMDTLLGELIEALHETGRWDSSMIVLTSDHTWRVDPELDEYYIAHALPLGGYGPEPPPPEFTHVPLIIKHPHQSTRRDIREPFVLSDLGDLLFASPSLATVREPADIFSEMHR